MSANTTPVREYHNGLAQHLLDLIRKSTSALASSASASASPDTTPRTRKTQVVTPPLPANPRQHSDSSLDSNSKMSSGETTQSRKSSVQRTEQSTADEGEDEEEEERRRDADGISERNDMTARPDAHPPRFPSIPQFNVEDAPQDGEAYTEAESSATGARRHAAGAAASRPSPSSTSPTNDSGKIPRSRISTYPTTYAEHLTREAEHRKAWETTGRKVWRNMPVNFELKLAPIDLKQKKKARTGSNESNSLSHSQSASEMSGAGPGTAIRPDDVFVPELDGEQEQEQERLSSSNPTNIETVSEVSRNDRGEGESGLGPVPSESSVSMSIAKPTIKRRSTLQRRQARVEAEAAADVEAKAAVENPEQSHEPQTEPDTQPESEDEQAEYARKREMRLRKKEQALKKRIGTWRAGVSDHCTPASSAAVTPPEIEPHIPSPKLGYAQAHAHAYNDHTSMLRFPPLPTSAMPDFLGGDSPMLKLPSLQLIEDGRRSRPGFEPLNVDMGNGGKTTDIDLLIRLTEMSRVSSPSAAAAGGGEGAGRARFPSAPPAPSSGGLIAGDRIETHSFNVRGSTTTPKPKPAMRSVFSGFGSQI